MASTSPVVPNRPIPDMIPRAAVGPSDPTRDDEPRISRRSDGVGRPERRHRHPLSSSAAPPPNRTGSDRLSDPVATPPVGDTTVLDNEDAIASTRTPEVGSGWAEAASRAVIAAAPVALCTFRRSAHRGVPSADEEVLADGGADDVGDAGVLGGSPEQQVPLEVRVEADGLH